jgi:hypothetical protein
VYSKIVVEKLAKLAGDPRMPDDMQAEYNEALVAASRHVQLSQRQDAQMGLHLTDERLLQILASASSADVGLSAKVALDLAIERIKQAKAERDAARS